MTFITGRHLLPRGWQGVPGRAEGLPWHRAEPTAQGWFTPALPPGFCAGSGTTALPWGAGGVPLLRQRGGRSGPSLTD